MLLTDAELKDAALQPSKMLAYSYAYVAHAQKLTFGPKVSALQKYRFTLSPDISLYYKMLSSYPGKLFE
jgi:hypothetical protein